MLANGLVALAPKLIRLSRFNHCKFSIEFNRIGEIETMLFEVCKSFRFVPN